MSRTLILSALLGLAACSGSIPGDDAGDALSKVNGAVTVAAGQKVGDVSTVNGAVEIGEGASVGEATTVNGAVRLAPRSQASAVTTVNGSVRLGAGAHVTGTIKAVNGGVLLGQGASVDGAIGNVNGAIVLEAARVGGGIETTAGDITVGADSAVKGGILVDKPGGFSIGFSREPRIVIGPRATVEGTLEFRRAVVLQVSDSAHIGPVKGATATMFSGEQPPAQ